MKKLLISILLLISTSANSTGIPVFDISVFGQSITTALNSAKSVANEVKDYALQLQQYGDMVKNTLAPEAYIWSQGNQLYQTAMSYDQMAQYYMNGTGGITGYLNTYQSAGYYAGSPCFNSTGCSFSDISAIHDKQLAASTAQKIANDAQLKAVSTAQDQLQKDAADLSSIQKAATLDLGRNDMIGTSNQLLGANVNNLLSIRALMMSQQEADNAKNADAANKYAITLASDKSMLAGDFVKSPVLDYSKYVGN